MMDDVLYDVNVGDKWLVRYHSGSEIFEDWIEVIVSDLTFAEYSWGYVMVSIPTRSSGTEGHYIVAIYNSSISSGKAEIWPELKLCSAG
jgi:hypothetical protein